ncbi:uncharacterized protein MELLADRAFT_105274 [Melampsora larici-populina 98AG31]|uniref:Uncharacterized protein n=1 Tax=Melampsora larici-populina (strain 98AG31 / pathotype 3-4-7) TaxID=747676 RepID=F4RHK4_MELLP|nr:uncharacterized protein MELLADRAFT_105274 [Melampsora larici-populina 98AG31]EGG08255.1 hypothetical protein MELLADRAFT_105274 [Melampsora larici-populina 98AG31]
MPPRHREKGLAVPEEIYGSEVNLLYRFSQEMPYDVGPDDSCTGCGAFRWKIERRQSDANRSRASFRNCCKHGAIDLPLRYFPADVGEQIPQFFCDLLSGRDRLL